MKVTTLTQLKAVNASRLRLSLEETSKFIHSFKNSILFEQSFISETASLTKVHAKINFRESIVLTSQIACQVSKLIKT